MLNPHKIVLLNTRPQPQNQLLTKALEAQLALEVIQFPTIEIDLFSPIQIQKQLPLKTIDYFIFTSVNAVQASFEALMTFHQSHRAIAIGTQTKQALEAQGWQKVIIPEIASSEGVLALTELQQIKNKHILVVTGKAGRGLLQASLCKKQANVSEVICYQRQIAQKSLKNALTREQLAKIAIVLISSIQGFDNLVDILGAKMNLLTASSQWLVFSERIQEYLKGQVPEEAIMVCEPNQKAVIDACKLLCEDRLNARK